MNKLFTGIAGGFFLRWFLELGGWATLLFQIYNALSPAQQASIQDALQGNWQAMTLGTLAGIATVAWARIWAYRVTTTTQTVTTTGERIIPATTTGREAVDATAETIVPKRTIADRLRNAFSRRGR